MPKLHLLCCAEYEVCQLTMMGTCYRVLRAHLGLWKYWKISEHVSRGFVLDLHQETYSALPLNSKLKDLNETKGEESRRRRIFAQLLPTGMGGCSTRPCLSHQRAKITYLFCIFNLFCQSCSQNHGFVLKVGWKGHIYVNSAHSRAHYAGKCRQAKPTFKWSHRLIPSFLSQSESIPHAEQLLLPSCDGISSFLPAGLH